jgi:hypothetical protein
LLEVSERLAGSQQDSFAAKSSSRFSGLIRLFWCLKKFHLALVMVKVVAQELCMGYKWGL